MKVSARDFVRKMESIGSNRDKFIEAATQDAKFFQACQAAAERIDNPKLACNHNADIMHTVHKEELMKTVTQVDALQNHVADHKCAHCAKPPIDKREPDSNKWLFGTMYAKEQAARKSGDTRVWLMYFKCTRRYDIKAVAAASENPYSDKQIDCLVSKMGEMPVGLWWYSVSNTDEDSIDRQLCDAWVLHEFQDRKKLIEWMTANKIPSCSENVTIASS